ncbi:MAG: siphovirus ReqiPepy6 Gp37-like family protein [Promicromonosporaceae bacterium]|nr:siphovirus ReqiPepy6 Gp37-like family protein [Promicromonosporaceae bacterium]
MTAWTVWPRDPDLVRRGDPLTWWSQLVHVKRYNQPNTWTLTGPSSQLIGLAPGCGVILDRDGVQVDSGNVREIWRTRTADPDTGRLTDTTTLAFTSDKDVLWSRLCWPDPAHDLGATPSSFAVSHDVRTGPRETVLLGYIAANLGPTASISRRRLASLVVPSSNGRGGTVTAQARMDVLGDLVATLAEAAGLILDVQHDESSGAPRLALSVTTAPDVSGTVVFGPPEVARATAPIVGLEYRLTAPDLTDAVMFAAGDEEARVGARFSDEAAVTLWARRREALIDQRQTNDATALAAAGADSLAQGSSPVALAFTVADSHDVVLGRDYDVGSLVGFETPELPDAWVLDNRVREVTTTVEAGGTERHDVVVGTPGATARDTRQARLLARVLPRLAALERSL